MRRLQTAGIRHAKTAYTVIELLVALSLVSLLVALLLPSVQSAREAARRVQCSTNLQQMGLALQMYHGVHRGLPPGINSQTSMFWSGAILPFLEQGSLFEKLDPNKSWTGGTNAQVLRIPVAVFRCPSSLAPKSDFHGIGGRVPATYLGCVSGTENRETGPQHRLFSDAQDGVLYSNSRTRLFHIRDGTSTTIMLGETLVSPWPVGPDDSGMPQYIDHWPVGSPTLRANEISEALGSTAAPIGVAATRSRELYPDDLELSFSSRHADGTEFLFCDGHVTLISHRIDRGVYSALGTRAQHDSIDAADY